MGKITYYKRVVNNETQDLHYHHDKGDHIKGKSYPEYWGNFDQKDLIEISLDEWLDEGLKLGIFKSDDLAPGLSSS